MTTDDVIQPDDSTAQPGCRGPREMNDEVARLVRLAGTSGPTAPLDAANGSHVCAPRSTARGAMSTSPAK